MSLNRRAAGLPGAGLLVAMTVLLGGCAATSSPARPIAVTSSLRPQSTQASTVPTSAASPTLTPEASGQVVVSAAASDADPAHPSYDVIQVPGQKILGHLTNIAFPVQIPHDGGPIEYAEGTPIKEGSRVVAYRVASGDIYDYIARRFHLTNNGYLIVLNESRRGEAAFLYAGDVLNLSAYTLNKYGTINGHIARGPQPITAPRQEN